MRMLKGKLITKIYEQHPLDQLYIRSGKERNKCGRFVFKIKKCLCVMTINAPFGGASNHSFISLLRWARRRSLAGSLIPDCLIT